MKDRSAEQSIPKQLREQPAESLTEPLGEQASKTSVPDQHSECQTRDKSNSPAITGTETRAMVTPYAFTVSPDLLGEPLAPPSRRGIAMIIDLLIISVLSTISALVFAGFVALTFFRAGNQVGKKNDMDRPKTVWRGTKTALRVAGTAIVFVLVFVVAQEVGGDDVDDNQTSMFDKTEIVELAVILASSNCKLDEECVREAIQPMAEYLAEVEVSRTEAQLALDKLTAKSDLPLASSEQVLSQLLDVYDQALIEQEQQQITALSPESTSVQLPVVKQAVESDDEHPTFAYRIIGWIEGIMAELGLGLGWAALYFSVFTAWCNGQTIGKKLLGIKVVRLDGITPTLWESFGRYGGYAAGFATGLSGFLQVYWDPNRQAIQDKISETLVLRVKP